MKSRKNRHEIPEKKSRSHPTHYSCQGQWISSPTCDLSGHLCGMAIPSAVAADLGVAAGTPTAWRSIIGPSPACFFMEKNGKILKNPHASMGIHGKMGNVVHGKMGKKSMLFMGKWGTVGEKQWEMAQWPMVKLPHVPLIYHGQSEWASIC